MDLNRLGRGEMIAALSGVVLIIVMFLNWWGVSDTIEGIELADIAGLDTTFNAWQASDFNDIVWFVTGVAALGLGVVAATQTRPNLPVAGSALVTALGILALLLIVIRLIDPPGDLGREYGVWLGMIAILGIIYGTWTAMQEEGTSLSEEAGRVSERIAGAEREGSAPPPPPEQPRAPEREAPPRDEPLPPPPPSQQPPAGGGPPA